MLLSLAAPGFEGPNPGGDGLFQVVLVLVVWMLLALLLFLFRYSVL